MEFRSDRLWESFIKWETEGKRLQNITAIYDRLLATPTQGYTNHFDKSSSVTTEGVEHISNNGRCCWCCKFYYLSFQEQISNNRRSSSVTTEAVVDVASFIILVSRSTSVTTGGVVGVASFIILVSRSTSVTTEGVVGVEHISNNPPQKVLSVDEFLTQRREVLQLLKQYDTEEAAPGEDVDAPPGEEPEEQPSSKTDEETTALRERIISLRRKIHKATTTAVADRWNFEEGIKRPYFHVKPLERCQLKNWKEYLDFEIEHGDHDRILILFERCLIACALYEEFWIKPAICEFMSCELARKRIFLQVSKLRVLVPLNSSTLSPFSDTEHQFVHYLESKTEMDDKIRDVYERACTIHHPKKPSLHLHWAVYEESHKNYDKASDILTNLEKVVPNMLQVAYRLINLERRRGNFEKVCALYEHYITNSKNKVKGDIETSVSILNKAVEKDKILEDISGNTCVENPREPQRDLGCETTQFVRTREQDHILGIYTSSELGAESQEGDGLLKSLEEGQFPLEQLEKEVLQFQTNCPECFAPCQTNMKLTDIPFFKQVVIMATNCDICGYRTNEVKTGGGIEPRGLHIEINVTGIDDFSRDVLKSETCSLLIPELDLEVGPAALGGRFSTVEGILTAMRDQIISGGGMFGDSADTHLKERFQMFFKDMDKVIRGEKHVTLVLDDPAGNSYVQSLTPPTPDDGLKITHYERTFDQNEELGLNDIKVENYEES
uniref:Zinc finger ZPR1-type domain-containing protein n=1 Tax=Timema bartmani TaxID=61472 RepID=A0A7R9EWN4_9NEOP|nr:unnamed protein product [Timema bartmani]